MKMKQVIISSSLTVILLSTSFHVFAKQWVTSLNAIQGGSCASFGSGWSDFAWDGKSHISFCKQVTNSNPTIGVLDVKGHVGKVNCARQNDKAWEAFAYDGKADITFCMKNGNVNDSENYVADVNAFVAPNDKVPCDDAPFVGAERGWGRVVYNGHSHIMFCARFK